MNSITFVFSMVAELHKPMTMNLLGLHMSHDSCVMSCKW